MCFYKPLFNYLMFAAVIHLLTMLHCFVSSRNLSKCIFIEAMAKRVVIA